MKIFLDTASLKEISEAAALGVVDGVTTNPSLLAKESGDPEADPARDLPHRGRPDLGRGGGHRRRGHGRARAATGRRCTRTSW